MSAIGLNLIFVSLIIIIIKAGRGLEEHRSGEQAPLGGLWGAPEASELICISGSLTPR